MGKLSDEEFRNLRWPDGEELALSIREARFLSKTEMNRMREFVSARIGESKLLKEVKWYHVNVVIPDGHICTLAEIPYDRADEYGESVAIGLTHFYYLQLKGEEVA